jgi:cytochrome c-type biogenesis protein CcmE
VARRQSPARLVVAVLIAALLGVFLLYTSVAGGGRASLQPSELGNRTDEVMLGGKVVRPVRVRGRTAHFRLRDVEGDATVRVKYADALPDQFRVGREIALEGRLRNGVFVGVPDSMVTKCPSKYTDKKT